MGRINERHHFLGSPSSTRFGSAVITFHWILAAQIVFLGTLELLFDHIPLEAQPLCINVGGCVGLVYFALVIARPVWRSTHRGWIFRPAYTIVRPAGRCHQALYALMLLIPTFGVAAYFWRGRVQRFRRTGRALPRRGASRASCASGRQGKAERLNECRGRLETVSRPDIHTGDAAVALQ